ncbi:MAG: flagellar biosynthetic protein FliO [Lachnospiraceae bacterium]|nr:flagellar biosynthetic protein FliO [Lachnospiraceae bacterium]
MIFLLTETVKKDILSNSSNSALKLVGLVLLCAIIIVACYYTTRFIGKKSQGVQGQAGGKNIKALETFRVTQNKYLQLIKCGDKYLLIGVSKDNITVLSEIDGESLLLETKDAQHKKFKDIIYSLSRKKSEAVSGGDEETAGSDSISAVINSLPSVEDEETGRSGPISAENDMITSIEEKTNAPKDNETESAGK